ncbi:hypothetical protein TCAL_17336 [Tigriopus californicus]|uniref:Transposase Tc1-like domain-containing protein n=1 Tax=Tigriopus californicus TaxID=6832 RepID=A0A553NYE7_TIGCA|nr:hypothetical protein TCAL_17336 [Tigriopus californicus]
MDQTTNRTAVIELLRKDVATATIMKTLKVNKMFVWRCRKRLEEMGGDSRRPGSGRPRSLRTSALVKAVSSKVRRNPARSISTMAKEYSVSRRTMGRVVKEDLGLHPYRLRRRQLLSTATRSKRLTRSKLLKDWLAANPDVITQANLVPHSTNRLKEFPR